MISLNPYNPNNNTISEHNFFPWFKQLIWPKNEENTVLVEQLIKSCDPNLLIKQDRFGCTVLHNTISSNQTDIAKLVIQKIGQNFNPIVFNIQNELGKTALHKAISCHETGVACLLIKNGNSDLITYQDTQGLTALHYLIRIENERGLDEQEKNIKGILEKAEAALLATEIADKINQLTLF